MKTGFNFSDLLTLDKFITPTIITVVYWIFLVMAIVWGVVLITFSSVIVGLLTIILAPIYVRVFCEITVLFFKIHGVLCEIRDQRKVG